MRRLALATIGMALALCPTAGAAERYLRPATTAYQNSPWVTSPLSSPLYAVLADAVVQPQAPGTSTDYATGSGGGTQYAAVGLTQPSVASGENITSTTAWVYASTGPQQYLTFSLWSGTQVLSWSAIAPGQSAAWHSLTLSPPVTAAQASQLYLLLRSDNQKNNPWGNVYAAYVDLTTDAQDPQPATNPPAPGPGPTPPRPGVTIPVRAVHVVESHGRAEAPVTVGCPATTVGRCRGTLTLVLLPDRSGTRRLAVVARCGRGCRPIGRGSFSIASGHRRRVRVRMALRRAQLFGRRRHRRSARLTADMRDGTGHRTISRKTITLTG